jgi:hypothetical protein
MLRRGVVSEMRVTGVEWSCGPGPRGRERLYAHATEDSGRTRFGYGLERPWNGLKLSKSGSTRRLGNRKARSRVGWAIG